MEIADFNKNRKEATTKRAEEKIENESKVPPLETRTTTTAATKTTKATTTKKPCDTTAGSKKAEGHP